MSKVGGFLGILEGHDSHELQFGLIRRDSLFWWISASIQTSDFQKQLSLSKPISTCASSPLTVPSIGFAVAGSHRRLPGNDGAGSKKCLDNGSTYVFSEVRIKTCGSYHSLAPVSEFFASQGGPVFPLRLPGHSYWTLLWKMTSSFHFVSFLSALLCLKKLETNQFFVFFQGEGDFEILFFCWM